MTEANANTANNDTEMTESTLMIDPDYTVITRQPGVDEAPETSRYQCSLCDKQYDRLDHVKRHMHSRKSRV